MENLNKNANYTYEKDVTGFKREEAKDVTADKINSVGKKFVGAIKKILDDGKYYLVELEEGYTLYGQTSRYARKNGEIGFIARAASEEKEKGLTFEDYKKGFTENKIHFNGKDIPTFIDTEEDYQAALKKEQEKAKKAEEKKAKKAEETKKGE